MYSATTLPILYVNEPTPLHELLELKPYHVQCYMTLKSWATMFKCKYLECLKPHIGMGRCDMRLIPAIFAELAGILLYILACYQDNIEKMCIMVIMAIFVMFMGVMLYIEGDDV